MKSEFEKGKEHERVSHSKFFHFFLGWACVTMAIPWFFFSVWDFRTRLSGMIFLLVVGFLALHLGYSERKQLKELR